MFDLVDPLGALVRGLFLTMVAVLWTLLLVRLVGLRAFSKMTAFDFVTTIATGSLIATAGTQNDWSDYLQVLAAIAGVFAIQVTLAWARRRWPGFGSAIRNPPVLLVEDGRILESALQETRVSRPNIMEKVRGSGAASLEDVRAMVLETTGDISVLTGEVDPALLDGVKRV